MPNNPARQTDFNEPLAYQVRVNDLLCISWTVILSLLCGLLS
jgi:hypothetical protein